MMPSNGSMAKLGRIADWVPRLPEQATALIHESRHSAMAFLPGSMAKNPAQVFASFFASTPLPLLVSVG